MTRAPTASSPSSCRMPSRTPSAKPSPPTVPRFTWSAPANSSPTAPPARPKTSSARRSPQEPANPSALAGLAHALLLQNKFPEARRAANAALGLQPSAEAYLVLARADLHDNDSAAAAGNTCKRRLPWSPPATTPKPSPRRSKAAPPTATLRPRHCMPPLPGRYVVLRFIALAAPLRALVFVRQFWWSLRRSSPTRGTGGYSMKRFLPLLAAFLLLIAALPAAAQILRLHIDGTIQPIAAEAGLAAPSMPPHRATPPPCSSNSTLPAACSTPPARSSPKSRPLPFPSSSSSLPAEPAPPPPDSSSSSPPTSPPWPTAPIPEPPIP